MESNPRLPAMCRRLEPGSTAMAHPPSRRPHRQLRQRRAAARYRFQDVDAPCPLDATRRPPVPEVASGWRQRRLRRLALAGACDARSAAIGPRLAVQLIAGRASATSAVTVGDRDVEHVKAENAPVYVPYSSVQGTGVTTHDLRAPVHHFWTLGPRLRLRRSDSHSVVGSSRSSARASRCAVARHGGVRRGVR